jgi:hypothetical protein
LEDFAGFGVDDVDVEFFDVHGDVGSGMGSIGKSPSEDKRGTRRGAAQPSLASM